MNKYYLYTFDASYNLIERTPEWHADYNSTEYKEACESRGFTCIYGVEVS